MRDLERTLSRLSIGSGNGRDLLALRLAFERLPDLKAVLAGLITRACAHTEQAFKELPVVSPSEVDSENEPLPQQLIAELASQITPQDELARLIARAIVDEPPLALKEGGLIRDGFDASLDELRLAMREGKDWIARLQQQEIERTGIASLKVRFNSVFGYYLEVTKSNLDKVPAHYVDRKSVV